MNQDFITVVSGLPRSGTSLMMQMLAAGGCLILTDNVRTPDESNPRGYLEFEAVKRLRADQSWLTQAAGKAVKIIHLLLRELPTDGRFQYRVLLLKRPIEEIIASQQVMLGRDGKTSADPLVLSKVFLNQLAQVEDWMAEQGCFATRAIDYHQVLQDPLKVAGEIRDFLGFDLDLAAMVAAVDPTLYRQRHDAITDAQHLRGGSL